MATGDALEKELEVRDPGARLMLQVKDDVQGAFATLVERCQHRLLRVMVHLVGRNDEAENLAQEVFPRIYKTREGYRPRAKFSTWLLTIANNPALNHLRSKGWNPTLPTGGSGNVQASRPAVELLASSDGRPRPGCARWNSRKSCARRSTAWGKTRSWPSCLASLKI